MYEKPWTLSTEYTDWFYNHELPAVPILKINFDGSSSECREYLSETALVRRMPSWIDVTYRLHTDYRDLNGFGILGVTDTTGEYILECEADIETIFEIINVANLYGDRLHTDSLYKLWIEAEDGLVQRWTVGNLIVLSADGNILREQSLIPPGLNI